MGSPNVITPSVTAQRTGFLAIVWARLTSKPRHETYEKHPDPRPLDIDQIQQDPQLEAKGAQRGTTGVSAPDYMQLTGPAEAFVVFVEKALPDYTDWANMRLHSLNEQLAQCNVVPAVNRALQRDK